MKTAELLKFRLEQVFQWYRGMVNPESGRLEYLYVPETDTFVREQCPIRDIGSVWDIELLSDFLDRQELGSVIEKSLRQYSDYLTKRDKYLILDSHRLEEPSSIAHSAFMILALLHGPQARKTGEITELAEGILGQQRPDGSYKIYFDDLPDAGEELYAGEAMLALLEYNRQSPNARFIESAARSLEYYDVHYFRSGRVGNDLFVFFANWQSQAARAFVECTSDAALKQEVTDYIFRLHDKIIERGFYSDVERHPARQVSVEVACALEGINDALAIAVAANDKRVEQYSDCICTGSSYLLELQSTDSGSKKERGGFGVSLSERAQRIDITGHAASAFMKSVENGIECELG